MSQDPSPLTQLSAQYVDSAAWALGLSIDPAYRSGVIENMDALLAIAQSVLAFPLPPDLEAASSFNPLPLQFESTHESCL